MDRIKGILRKILKRDFLESLIVRLHGEFRSPVSTRDVYGQLTQIDRQLTVITQTKLDDKPEFMNELVDKAILEAKCKEFFSSFHKFQFQYSTAITHLRCLLNWVHTPPPQGAVNIDDKGEYDVGGEDQEFLRKIAEAKARPLTEDELWSDPYDTNQDLFEDENGN